MEDEKKRKLLTIKYKLPYLYQMKHSKVSQGSWDEKDEVLLDKYGWVLDTKLPNEWEHKPYFPNLYNQPGIINPNEEIKKRIYEEIEKPKQIKKEQEEFDKLPDKAKEEIKDKQATIERQLHTIDLQNQRNEEHKVILFIAAVVIVIFLLVALGINF